jgi:hypothetical protein
VSLNASDVVWAGTELVWFVLYGSGGAAFTFAQIPPVLGSVVGFKNQYKVSSSFAAGKYQSV